MDEPEPKRGVTEEEMERHALKMLNRRLREGRWYPVRHQQFALLIIVILLATTVAIVLVVAAVSTVLGG